MLMRIQNLSVIIFIIIFFFINLGGRSIKLVPSFTKTCAASPVSLPLVSDISAFIIHHWLKIDYAAENGHGNVDVDRAFVCDIIMMYSSFKAAY